MIKLGIKLLILFVSFSLVAEQSTVSMTIQQLSLRETLYAIAKSLHKDALISDQIKGNITIDVKSLPPFTLLTLICNHYGIKWEQHNQLLIFTTTDEWLSQQTKKFDVKTLMNNHIPLQMEIVTVHYAKSENIVSLLKNNKTDNLVSKRGHLDADKRTNTILIHDTKDSIAIIKKAISALDKPIKQLLIETHLVSVDHNYEKNIGLTYDALSHPKKRRFSPNFRIGHLIHSLDVTLSLLEQQGAADILSSPRLFTADQETASIETGEEVPYQETSENGGTTIAFKKAVLGLKITPHLLPAGRILLNIHMNHDKPTQHLVGGMPMITTRQITTNVILRNKETIVLGGIYERDIENNVLSIIGLSDIPLLGNLFKKHIEKQHKRELLIFVTPIIMNN